MSDAPSSDTSVSQMWKALSLQERQTQIVDFPRKGPDGAVIGRLRVRILTQEEEMVCVAAAEKLAKEHLKDSKKRDIGYERLYADALCVEVLFRACRDVDDLKRPAFPSPKHLRQALTTDECLVLFQTYVRVQSELGPASYAEEQDEAL